MNFGSCGRPDASGASSTNSAQTRDAGERSLRFHPEFGRPDATPYLDAGFTGFTFNNSIYRTTDQIAVLGDVLRIVQGATAAA